MPYDNTCKRLAEYYPLDFANWLLGKSLKKVEMLKTELSKEPVRADSLLLFRAIGEILHIEFQTTPRSNPALELRMLDYYVQSVRKYNIPIVQFVILLLKTDEQIVTEYRAQNTWHQYNVIKLWEMEPDIFLSSPGLLPLAPLTKTKRPLELLKRVADETMKIPPEAGRAELISCASILSGLIYGPETIGQYFPEELMQESVIYKEILKKGLARGREEGREEGLIEGRVEGLIEGRVEGREEGREEGKLEMVMRIIARRFGEISRETHAQIEKLNVSLLDDLGEELVTFQNQGELNAWLSRNGKA